MPYVLWLIEGALGPALVNLPVNWAASDLAKAARNCFRRFHRSDDLSRIITAAGGQALRPDEFRNLRAALEDDQTWQRLGHCSVEDLAALIATYLVDRSEQEAVLVSRAIARGLVEFAVSDLDPQMFQRVLLARLGRMEMANATALDAVMLKLQADLAARIAQQRDEADFNFDRLTRQLALMLDRLPPGPAERSEIAIYLATLIKWLNIDPWPKDARFAGPELTPATIERKLRISDHGHLGRQDLDADELARECVRLVVLGGPGSGKTWLARKTARLRAEGALRLLSAGAAIDEVELPLYTTCSQLLAAPGDIRQAVVSSALDQLPDMGSPRINDALLRFFKDRQAPTVLVIDSLDEAHGPGDRIRQAETLPPTWRIVLTSRPGSWNNQLLVGQRDQTRRIGILQPLRYPADVEPFIAGWFRERPDWGRSLTDQLERRPALQQAATVPLILAFYCIIGGDRPLPERRRDLYDKVIRRMLTGRWRDSRDRDPDLDVCLEILREWAWSGAVKDPLSGVGTWADEVPTPHVRVGRDDRDALDHLANPLTRNADTGNTVRRFAHRSFREHLLAEHVAMRVSTPDAAAELLNHIWYDPDWEYAAPSALAMHPGRDQILRTLIHRITGAEQLTERLSPVDGCWELRRFLAQVALESSEDDWSADARDLIASARIQVAMDHDAEYLRQSAPGWAESNSVIRVRLIAQLGRVGVAAEARKLAQAIARVSLSEPDQAQARAAMLELLDDPVNSGHAGLLVEALAGLEPRPRDKASARHKLLTLLASLPDKWLQTRTETWHVGDLVEALGELGLTAQDRIQARATVLTLLAEAVGRPFHEIGPGPMRELAEALAQLDPIDEDQVLARDMLLMRLEDAASRPFKEIERGLVREIVVALAQLDLTPEDQGRARAIVLRMLAEATDSQAATELVEYVAGFGATARDSSQARRALLRLLADSTDSRSAQGLAESVAGLEATAEDRSYALDSLLGLLADSDPGPQEVRELAEAAAGLAVTADERRQARESLLDLLGRATDSWRAKELIEAVFGLAVTTDERARTRRAFLVLLSNAAGSRHARRLAEAVAELGPTPEDESQAREAVLELLPRIPGSSQSQQLTAALVRLNPTPDDRARARRFLLGSLARAKGSLQAQELADALSALDPSSDDKRQARSSLLRLLVGSSAFPRQASTLADALARFDPSAADKRRARNVLLELLGDSETFPQEARELTRALARLSPTANDLASARRALLGHVASRASSSRQARELAEAIARLDPLAEERADARQMLLTLLARTPIESAEARDIAEAMSWLDPTNDDLTEARTRLLELLRNEPAARNKKYLTEALAWLAITPADRALVRSALLALLARAKDPLAAQVLAQAISGLDPTTRDRARAREFLMKMLTDPASASHGARALAEAVAGLIDSAEDPAQARHALLQLLSHETDGANAQELVTALSRLYPTVDDVAGREHWAVTPSPVLLAAVRRNTPVADWIDAIPALTGPPARQRVRQADSR